MPNLQGDLDQLPPSPASGTPIDGTFWLRSKKGERQRCDHRFNRLDEWVPEAEVRIAPGQEAEVSANGAEPGGSRKRKRGDEGLASDAGTPRAGLSGTPAGDDPPAAAYITEEEYDIQHHKQITAKRNFDKVIFGRWEIKTW